MTTSTPSITREGIEELVKRLKYCAAMYDDVSSRECARAAVALQAVTDERDEVQSRIAVLEAIADVTPKGFLRIKAEEIRALLASAPDQQQEGGE